MTCTIWMKSEETKNQVQLTSQKSVNPKFIFSDRGHFPRKSEASPKEAPQTPLEKTVEAVKEGQQV